MHWEETIAFCYLKSANDEKNKVLLTHHQLKVTQKGKLTVFVLDQVEDMYFSQKKWLFPLILGGVIAPFMLIAILLNLYNPWPLFVVFVLAFLAFYVGWTLHPALTIKDKAHEHHFFLPDISDNLKAFVSFTNRYRYNMTMEIFHIANQEDWQAAKESGFYTAHSLHNQGFIHASTEEQLKRLKESGIFTSDKKWVILTMDLLRLQPEVRFEAADDPPGFSSDAHELFPHIYGNININAVTDISPLYP